MWKIPGKSNVISGQYVTRLLGWAAIFRGYLLAVRTDNCPEFTSRALMVCAMTHPAPNPFACESPCSNLPNQSANPARMPSTTNSQAYGCTRCRSPTLGQVHCARTGVAVDWAPPGMARPACTSGHRTL